MKTVFLFFARAFGGLQRRLWELGTVRPYYDEPTKRAPVLREMFARIDQGVPWVEVMMDRRARQHGERIPEYTFAYDLLRRLRPARLLDVGCVLNNSVIDPQIPTSCAVSFLNPASEPIVRSRATYYRMPMEEFRPAGGYPVVTCLSTIEHIGFDNTRYGINLLDEGWDWPTAIRKWVEIVRQTSAFVAPGGTLLVSCPYGREEFVLLPPVTGARTSQVVNLAHVRALALDPVLKDAELRFMRCEPDGWVSVPADAEFPPYGDVCPGASGVILLTWIAPLR